MMQTISAEPPCMALQPLREDLRLNPSSPNPDGSPAWTIQDPIGNVFYRIGWLEFEMLARWHLGGVETVTAAMRQETTLDATSEEVEQFQQFLLANHLLQIHSPQYTTRLLEQFRRTKLSRTKWLLHNYLFFRIPLWHPDRLLARVYPHLAWIYSRTTAGLILLLCMTGLFLAFRQWDVLEASFLESLSPSGLLNYLLALVIAKSLHEFGHALTATRYGVRVAHMGVAFLVLWPMLYTDTGESWRLKDRRQRLAIASAGILTELVLAGLATLAWSLAPPGDTKHALFFLATTSWLISLTLNASPFLRFDGYFILSDLLDFPNLHERSFAVAKTALRNRLWGWNDPWPEDLPSPQRNSLIAFAVAVWVYRLIVFTAIAIAVYLFFFKVLGILLFMVEIGWFVLRPIWHEVKVWLERRGEISRLRVFQIGGLLSVFVLIGLIPWNPQIQAEAWAHAESSHVLYSPIAARIENMPAHGGTVQKNDTVFTLVQPELVYREQVAELSSRSIQRQLSGLLGTPEGESQRSRLEKERAMRIAQSNAELAEQSRLSLNAPFDGELTDIDPELKPGVWVHPQQPLANLIDPRRWVVEAFVGQDELERIELDAPVRFYPHEDRLAPYSGKVVQIDHSRTHSLPNVLLSSHYGGQIAVLSDSDGLKPRLPLFKVRIQLLSPPTQHRVMSGVAVMEGKRRSWLGEFAKSILVVLIREASF